MTVETDIYNVEGPGLYRIEFNNRWEFMFCLPPMSLSDIEFLLEDLQGKLESAKDHWKRDPYYQSSTPTTKRGDEK